MTQSMNIAIEIAKQYGNSPYMTTEEAARFLKKSCEWLQLMRSKGAGPGYSRLGDSKNSPIIYSIVDLVKYVEDHTIKTA